MVKEKKAVHRIQMTEGKRQIIQQLLQEYNIETTADIQGSSQRSFRRNHQGNDGIRNGSASWISEIRTLRQ